jgi:3-oxoacyl-[acyl-carrier protein] reductase
MSDTPGLDVVLSAGPAAKVFRKALARQAFPLTSADVAQATLFLASSASDVITGQTLSVNGGLCFPG